MKIKDTRNLFSKGIKAQLKHFPAPFLTHQSLESKSTRMKMKALTNSLMEPTSKAWNHWSEPHQNCTISLSTKRSWWFLTLGEEKKGSRWRMVVVVSVAVAASSCGVRVLCFSSLFLFNCLYLRETNQEKKLTILFSFSLEPHDLTSSSTRHEHIFTHVHLSLSGSYLTFANSPH